MITLNTFLEDVGIPPDQTVVPRHTPTEKPLRRVMPWMVSERPDLFVMFQALQAEKFEAAMTKATYMASFLENGSSGAIFAGLFRLKGHRRVTFEEFWAVPENIELASLGMDGMHPGQREPLLFEIEPMSELAELTGKLCVEWPGPAISWWRWANRNEIPVTAIHPENAFSRGMPNWDQVVLSWSDLQLLPASWKSKLAEWRGIYYIFDVVRERGYVGAAYGDENLLGRWRNYAATGHGGNVRLRESEPSNLRFSILQRTSPDMLQDEVASLETVWKLRLHTRAHGLNLN